MTSSRAATAALLLFSAAAVADVELSVSPGDKIAGTIEPANESERFLAPLPAGATLTVKAKSAKGGPPLRLRILGPAGGPIADVDGTKPAVSKLAIVATGVHVVEVTSIDGAATGGYSFSVTWSGPKSASATGEVAAGGESTLAFGAPAGAAAKLSVRPSRGSAAAAELVSISGPNSFSTSLGPATTGAATLPAFGDYTLRFRNTGAAAGGIDAAVALKAPRTAKRKIDLSSRSVTPGVRVVSATLVTRDGGTLVSPGGPTAGASVTFPAGAVKKPILATLGEGTPVVPSVAEEFDPAGPAVFLGPEGSLWPSAAVTLPYDPAALPDGPSTLRVFTRDAEGDSTELTGFTIDEAAHTVTLDTTHFSTFQPLVVASKNATSIARLAYATPESSRDDFGIAVAISDAWIAVGAPGLDSDGLPDAGAVFVYPFANGVVGAPERIQAPSPKRTDYFGISVKLDGDLLVVGAPALPAGPQPSHGGSVFVYRRTGNQWAFEQELRSGTPDSRGAFGAFLAVDGTRMVVGASGEDNGQFGDAGAAYVFEFDGQTWVRVTRLLPSTPASGDDFGGGVAIYGSTVAVGSRDADSEVVPISRLGDVTVFARDPGSGLWQETDVVYTKPSQHIGFSVALGDGVLVIGTPSADPPDGEGSAFAFAGGPGSFALEDTLQGAGPLNFQFGYSFAIDGDRMLIGARGQGEEKAAGKAYSYKRKDNRWKREATMRGADVGLPSGGTDLVTAEFGRAVALRGKYFLVGAPSAPGGPNADQEATGAAFLFELDD